MESNNSKERTLAYTTARQMAPSELEKVSGGADDNGLKFTTKQTITNFGTYDVGVDCIW